MATSIKYRVHNLQQYLGIWNRPHCTQ